MPLRSHRITFLLSPRTITASCRSPSPPCRGAAYRTRCPASSPCCAGIGNSASHNEQDNRQIDRCAIAIVNPVDGSAQWRCGSLGLCELGKLVVPTLAGLQLFELLCGAAPTLVDPGTTAVWEMRLDDVVVGKADFRAVIDEIAGEAERLITVLRQHNGGTVDLSQPAPHRTKRGRSKVGRRSRSGGDAAAIADAATPKSRRPRRGKNAPRQQMGERKQND